MYFCPTEQVAFWRAWDLVHYYFCFCFNSFPWNIWFAKESWGCFERFFPSSSPLLLCLPIPFFLLFQPQRSFKFQTWSSPPFRHFARTLIHLPRKIFSLISIVRDCIALRTDNFCRHLVILYNPFQCWWSCCKKHRMRKI